MDASAFFSAKRDMPTDLRTAQLSRLPLWVKEQSFFMAGVINAEALSTFREAAQQVIDGNLSEQQALALIRGGLKKAGYKAGDGQEGTIKDLNTVRRQLVSLRTAVALARGYAKEVQYRASIAAFPCKELKRVGSAKVPRRWQQTIWPNAAAQRNAGFPDLVVLRPDVMMAPVGDPLWPMLSDFGAPYDPLKYGTGMRQSPVGFRAAQAQGLLPKAALKPGGARVPSSPDIPQPPEPPIPSIGNSLEVKPDIKKEERPALSETLGGLARWEGDSLIFTDPNGTRPALPEQLAPVLRGLNVDGTENYQLAAVKEWLALGGDEDAFAAMREKHAGTDLLDDWNRLTDRLQAGSPGLDLLVLLANLVRFLIT